MLAQGSSPLAYLYDHVKRYVDCELDDTKEGCDVILTPPKKTEMKRRAKRRSKAVRWPLIRKPHPHYIWKRLFWDGKRTFIHSLFTELCPVDQNAPNIYFHINQPSCASAYFLVSSKFHVPRSHFTWNFYVTGKKRNCFSTMIYNPSQLGQGHLAQPSLFYVFWELFFARSASNKSLTTLIPSSLLDST